MENILTLADLVSKYDSNGFVIDDAGNGCGGPTWMEWTEDTAKEFGGVEMFLTEENDFVGLDWPHDTLVQVAKDVCYYYDTEGGKLYASDVITDGTGDNPYRYRIIF